MTRQSPTRILSQGERPVSAVMSRFAASPAPSRTSEVSVATARLLLKPLRLAAQNAGACPDTGSPLFNRREPGKGVNSQPATRGQFSIGLDNEFAGSARDGR
jgi:hypothetical protein